jgi:cytochrome o ubiquinol oxidase subunit III
MMTQPTPAVREAEHRTIFGFWVYLMTDCILFAALFATYAVMHTNTFGGPSARDLFSLDYAFAQTMILLFSSFASGLAMMAAHQRKRNWTLAWFGFAFLLGATFLTLELSEFHHLIQAGHSWKRSGFLSSYFTLVGTHGLHITVGLLWMVVLLAPVIRHGFDHVSLKRLTCLSLFWHFLDVVWIFIFTVVYMMGTQTHGS